MFSGIIADVGYISEANDRDGGLRLVIATGTLDLGDVRIGDSIAVNGVCLTAVKRHCGWLTGWTDTWSAAMSTGWG
jgi:riboflavin synthase